MGLRPADGYPDDASTSPREPAHRRASSAEVQDALRAEQNWRFRQFVGWASLGSIIPGLGLLRGGKKRAGLLLLTLFVLLLGATVYVATTSSRSDLVALAVDPTFLVVSAGALALVAALLLVSSASSHHVLQPEGIRRGQRLAGALVVLLVTSMVVAPVAMASRYALVQYDLVTNVFTAADETPTGTTGTADDSEPAPPIPADPWEDVDRVNVLLIGSDAGPDREGTRPDTNVVASIDPVTGDAVLFSLPRNLEDVPFPSSSPLSDYYPFGWQGEPDDPGSELLNAIYRYVPAEHPEVFANADDPGAEAMKLAAEGVTGLPIDYYVMVDLDGFPQVVDALGGVDITVQQRIPLESSMLPAGYCSEPIDYIEPGRQRLNGYETLWYARVRCGGEGLSDDYDRMRRQRCIIGAMIERADPLTVLRRYEALAGTAQQIVATDIPTSMVPAFAELALRVQNGAMRSLPFTDRVINPGSPDYDGIQQQVQDALAPAPVASPSADVSSGSGSDGTDGATADPGATPDDGGATTEPEGPDESDGVLDLNEVC